MTRIGWITPRPGWELVVHEWLLTQGFSLVRIRGGRYRVEP